MKKLEVMGIELDCISTNEAMLLVEGYLNNSVLNTVEEVSMNMILQAKDDKTVRECIEKLDLAVPGEKELYSEGGYQEVALLRDMLDGTFFYEFCKRVVKMKKTVLVVGDTRNQVERVIDYIHHEYERMNIIGTTYFEKYKEEGGIVNEINAYAPDVILSIISSPHQETFLDKNKESIHARLWYGMNDRFQHFTFKERLIRRLKSLGRRVLFKLRLMDYNREQ